MSSYVFSGFPSFLESAANELGVPRSAGPARRIGALTDLANLCAQAAHGDPSHVEAILAKASDFRDHLATALLAADMMLADVKAGRRLPCPSNPEADPESGAMSSPRSARKTTRNERVSS